MISEWEIWGCANLVIQQHGEDAKFCAAGLPDHSLELGTWDARESGAGSLRRLWAYSGKSRLRLNPSNERLMEH